jgi:biopolymer transport protein ExbD
MPIGNPPPPTEPPQVITVDVDFDGTVYWNGDVVADKAALETRLRDAAAAGQPEVTCDPTSWPSTRTWPRSCLARRLGVTKLGLVGNEQFVR